MKITVQTIELHLLYVAPITVKTMCAGDNVQCQLHIIASLNNFQVHIHQRSLLQPYHLRHFCSQLSSNKSDSGLYSLVVFPDIWMMHLLSFPISLELKGRTLTATLTEAPAMMQVGAWASRRADDLCGHTNTHLEPAKVDYRGDFIATHAGGRSFLITWMACCYYN